MDIRQVYESIYRRHDMERIGLFACLRDLAPIRTVLYLGSSTHIAPSFIFRDVCYLDKNPMTGTFFAREAALREYVAARKDYAAEPRIRFVPADYRQTAELPAERFDLVLAINSSLAFAAAAACVKPGGLVLHLPLPQEATLLRASGNLELAGHIVFTGGRYTFLPGGARPAPPRRRKRRPVFYEDNVYEVYRGISSQCRAGSTQVGDLPCRRPPQALD